MPTREDMVNLHQALVSGDQQAIQTLAPMFGPGAMQDIIDAPDEMISAIEGRADQLGLSLTTAPTRGGATRGWTPESAGIPGAFFQGIQRGALAGGGPLGIGAPEGAPPVEGLSQNIAQVGGAAIPLGAGLLSGYAAGPLAARLAATRGPGLGAALIRALGPSAVRGGIGEAGAEGAAAAGGVRREPGQVPLNIAAGAGLGPLAGGLRRALPAGRGTGGAIRRLRHGPAPPTAPAAAIPEAGAGQVGGEVAEAGGDVTVRKLRAAVQEAMDPNNVLAPETTATSRVRTSMKKPRGRPHKKPEPPKGEKVVKAKPPRQKEAGKKPTPPKRRKGTASERLREKARKRELG